jgi:hypothetical protein
LEKNKVDTNKIPLVYKHLIIKIFNNYANTNNGVIINDATLFEKKGGASLNKNTAQDVYNQLIEYCRNNGDYDEQDISNYIRHSTGSISSTNYSNLKNFIESNKRVTRYNLTISYDPIYDYITMNEESMSGQNILDKNYTCFEYNKDIVTAYEYNYYTDRNKRAIENYIQKQKDYIRNLKAIDPISIRIIQDYTNENSFNMYNYAKSKPGENLNSVITFNIGDAFYKQIHELFPTILDRTAYNRWLSSDRIIDPKAVSLYKNILTSDDWRLVLNRFMIDLDNIIKNAPPVEEEIYCYRGVTGHYIKSDRQAPRNIIDDMSQAPRLQTFLSDRLSSFSLDFNAAKGFSDISSLPTKCVYRTTLMPQCRLLYVSQISVFKNELEFIAPSNSIFYYRHDQTINNDLIPDTGFNNITKQYGICSRNSFNSFDTILAFTPQPITADATRNRQLYDEAYRIASGIARNNHILDTIGNTIAEGFLSICPPT